MSLCHILGKKQQQSLPVAVILTNINPCDTIYYSLKNYFTNLKQLRWQPSFYNAGCFFIEKKNEVNRKMNQIEEEEYS